MKITPARSASDGGEIVKIGLVRQPYFCIITILISFTYITKNNQLLLQSWL